MKGLCLVCVVIGHAGCPTLLRQIIYLFHMPIFFMLSGYLFKEKYIQLTWRQYIKKRGKALLWPYFLFGVLTFLFYGFYRHFTTEYIWKSLSALIYSNFLYDERNYVGVIWFLTALFSTEILFFAIHKFIKKNVWRIIICACFVIVGLSWSKIFTFRLPFHLEIAFVALGFYSIGFYVKKLEGSILSRLSVVNKLFSNSIMLVLVGLSIFVGLLNCKWSGIISIDMLYIRYGIGIVFFIDSALLCVLLIMISMNNAALLNRSRILKWIGRNSLVFMSLHLMTMNAASTVFSFIYVDTYWVTITLRCIVLTCIETLVCNKLFSKIIYLK